MSQVIAIAGFTGKMARLISTALLRYPNVQINGICRSPNKVDQSLRSSPRVKIFESSSSDIEALRRGLRGASAAICCYLGDKNVMIDGQKALIDACIEEKVPRYIASDWSLDFRGLEFGDHPSKDPMKHVQVYLEEKEKEGKIKGVHILNGAFTEVMWGPYAGYATFPDAKFAYYGTGDEKFEMTTMPDVAEYTAAVAVQPGAVGFINVLGDKISVKEMAQTFQEVYGVEPTLENLGSLEELYTKMKLALKEQPENMMAWPGLHYKYYMANGSTSLGKLDNDRFPEVKPKSVKEFLESRPRDQLTSSYFSPA